MNFGRCERLVLHRSGLIKTTTYVGQTRLLVSTLETAYFYHVNRTFKAIFEVLSWVVSADKQLLTWVRPASAADFFLR